MIKNFRSACSNFLLLSLLLPEATDTIHKEINVHNIELRTMSMDTVDHSNSIFFEDRHESKASRSMSGLDRLWRRNRQRSNLRLRLQGGIGNEEIRKSQIRQVRDLKNTSLSIPPELEKEEEEEEEGHWKPMCRICYEFDQAGLFVPCKCTGSMGFVHR
jgi:hypothetical protein